MNSFVHDLFRRIANEAAYLSAQNKRVTISSREIKNAVRLVLNGELETNAISEGTKALTVYNLSKNGE